MSERRRVQIKDLLDHPSSYSKLILRQLQAGRTILPNGVNAPYRLSDEELELLRDEYIYYWDDGDRYFAAFEKDTNEIRALLNLPPQRDSLF